MNENDTNNLNETPVETQNKKKTKAKLCITKEDSEMTNLIENQLSNLEKMPFEL